MQCLLGKNDGGRMGSASSRLVTRVARLGGVTADGRAAGHWTRVIWVDARA